MKSQVLANRRAPKVKAFLHSVLTCSDIMAHQPYRGGDQWAKGETLIDDSQLYLGARLATRFFCRRGTLIVDGKGTVIIP